MAYLGTDKIKELITTKGIIGGNPDLNRVKSGAYELSLGEEIFRTDSKDRKKEFLKEDKEQITINPGQFALLLTQESVNIPLDKIAFISIKAKIKLRGLVNVSGFHVDPGFNGNLVFSVYNAGTSPILLEKGEPCFLIWFAELTGTETSEYNGEHKNQNKIPKQYIEALLSGELASPNVLSKRIDEVKSIKISNDWFLKTIIGLGVAISLKLLWDWNRYQIGFKEGYDLKIKEIVADSAYQKMQTDFKTLNNNVDSLINVIQKQSQPKNQSNGKIK